MFAKLSLLAVFVSVAAALTLETPSDVKSDSPITINWTSVPSDNSFNIYLRNPSFNRDYALANTVSPADGTITLTLPTVPAGGGYSLVATPITDANNVLSSTPEFLVGASTLTSSTLVSTSSATSVSSSGRSSSVSTTVTTVVSGTASTSSGFGVTRSSSTSGSSTGTGTTSSTSSAPSATQSGNGSKGAASASVAGVLLAAFAGVAVAAF